MDDRREFSTVRPLAWRGDRLAILDQRLLPEREVWLEARDAATVAAAIRGLAVRGAPAIAIAAAYGLALEARRLGAGPRAEEALRRALAELRAARPTAVNLAWALERMARRIGEGAEALLAEARRIEDEDLAGNLAMAEAGSAWLGPRSRVLTHCNTGALATAGIGTALGVIRHAWAAGRIERVYACETRPWLQGARLTMWELVREGIPGTLIADGAAAFAMARLGIDWLVVGADRIAANGDTANKIGTYALMLAARRHGVRTMVVAPTSSIDPATPSGAAIPIEERDPEELLASGGRRHVVAGAEVWNPVFDVTPAALIDLLVTERFVLASPDAERLAAALGGSRAPAC